MTAAALLVALGCGGSTPSAVPEPVKLDRVERAAFNRGAAELALPLFWATDDDGVLSPDELVVLWGAAGPAASWVGEDGFTEGFLRRYEDVVERIATPLPDGEPGSHARRRFLVAKELGLSRRTLVRSDFTTASAEDRALVQHLMAASQHIEKLYAMQKGTWELQQHLGYDPEPLALFQRNQGPWCQVAATRDDPDCTALSSPAPRRSGLYPAELQADPGFCTALQERPDADALMAPFVVVRAAEDALKAVPYTAAWPDEMAAVSGELSQAAAALGDDEAPLRRYLSALARAFTDNDWQAADEAWAAMNALNSRWYLRLGPDETYFEPCDRKAGFHMSFARINPASLVWTKKLDPLKADMEAHLAALAGKPYAAREVSFALPDFIDIVLNAGDSRDAFGGTAGQSLPNWGPVADEGRGRTVAMTNLGRDPDSVASRREVAASLLCADTMADYTDSAEPELVSTVLHEAAHNLGPSHAYRAYGKTAEQAFGGSLASTMEELKAQTAALQLTGFLADKGVVDETFARQAAVSDLMWAARQISRGMYADGYPNTYPQLAAIQLGVLLEEGGVRWKARDPASNGTDTGCLSLQVDAYRPAVHAMSLAVLGAKARNDVPAATGLVQRHVDGDGPGTALLPILSERVRRMPAPTYVYAIDL